MKMVPLKLAGKGTLVGVKFQQNLDEILDRTGKPASVKCLLWRPVGAKTNRHAVSRPLRKELSCSAEYQTDSGTGGIRNKQHRAVLRPGLHSPPRTLLFKCPIHPLPPKEEDAVFCFYFLIEKLNERS